MKRIAVTGGGGQIAYSLLFRIASGEIFGREQPIALHIQDIPSGMERVKGVVMELEDCAFSTLKEIRVGSDEEEVFDGVDLALLIGSKPRGAGMKRADLLADNGEIFVRQGRALNRVAAKGVLIFVVANPCNTNCLIALHHAPDIPPSRFFAMTRLDQNRARFQLAAKAGCDLSDVKRVAIWGNHSATQVPDFLHATICGLPAERVIGDRDWLEGEFFKRVQKRGEEIIASRGKSSAASAAQAIIDGVRALYFPTDGGEWFSSAVFSDGNPYGIKNGLVFSLPCTNPDGGSVQAVSGLEWDPFLREKIALTERELIGERDCIAHLLRR